MTWKFNGTFPVPILHTKQCSTFYSERWEKAVLRILKNESISGGEKLQNRELRKMKVNIVQCLEIPSSRDQWRALLQSHRHVGTLRPEDRKKHGLTFNLFVMT